MIVGYVRTPSDMLLRYVLERLGTNQIRAAEDGRPDDRPDDGAETIANCEQVQARLRAKLAEWLNDDNQP